ncbi:hypothetical protein E2562_031402 [Oryza meyeriana var. granulata]|uniref:40S ribosomal protein S8 n=1 Tax=Oryza meyeriana var. granulata TaxID=110450 RepID=A0A6G1BZS4_9ORYZ|nr:hypothetical protein E2562_031402 [Oryza meyeriana var. granulata]
MGKDRRTAPRMLTVPPFTPIRVLFWRSLAWALVGLFGLVCADGMGDGCAGISRDSMHKRRATGGKQKAWRKKRKYELGRQPANTKLSSNKTVRRVRVRGGNVKWRALRLDTGNYSWGSEAVTRKTRILDVVYNASNNELVRTQTLVKSAIVQVDAAPFKQWYLTHYGVDIGRKKKAPAAKKDVAEGQQGEAAAEETKKSNHVVRKLEKRQQGRTLDPHIEEQFGSGRLLACISSRPGQCGRADGYILEGKELEFYMKKLQRKKGKAVVCATRTPSHPDVFSLPAFLAAQCADYSSSADDAAVSAPSSLPRVVLPSELCLLRREVESWSAHHGVPGTYSLAAARVVAAALSCRVPRWEAELRLWVLASSPRYGVVIDAATRDHVWVLVRLCLKAAASEACCSLENACNAVGGGSGFDPRAIRFECPRLVEGVSWLGAQLKILYGEGSGRFFAIAAMREVILWAGSCLAVGVGGGVDSRGGEAGASGGSGVEGSDFGNVGTSSVFVAQVAAAIVALHERFSLEEKIKAPRAPRPSKYQLLLEYSQALERGHEERSKRPNYRAVLEYDGILSRRVDSQESDRAKTREELLAEERDYKRRRMSYRGKKVKRNPKEILRDIIDEHMEEINHAGGIGCLLDVPRDILQSKLKNSPQEGTYQGSFDPTSSSYVSSRNHGTRDSYKDLRNGSHQHQYQKVSDHENRRIKDSESTVDQRQQCWAVKMLPQILYGSSIKRLDQKLSAKFDTPLHCEGHDPLRLNLGKTLGKYIRSSGMPKAVEDH